MSESLSPIRFPDQIRLPEAPRLGGEPTATGEFGSLLNGAIGGTEQLRTAASQMVGNFLNGQGEELHSVIMATQRAEIGFEMFLQVRNKVVQAYQEIMRMQI